MPSVITKKVLRERLSDVLEHDSLVDRVRAFVRDNRTIAS